MTQLQINVFLDRSSIIIINFYVLLSVVKKVEKVILFSFCYISSRYSIEQRGKVVLFYSLYNSTAGKKTNFFSNHVKISRRGKIINNNLRTFNH